MRKVIYAGRVCLVLISEAAALLKVYTSECVCACVCYMVWLCEPCVLLALILNAHTSTHTHINSLFSDEIELRA